MQQWCVHSQAVLKDALLDLGFHVDIKARNTERI